MASPLRGFGVWLTISISGRASRDRVERGRRSYQSLFLGKLSFPLVRRARGHGRPWHGKGRVYVSLLSRFPFVLLDEVAVVLVEIAVGMMEFVFRD